MKSEREKECFVISSAQLVDGKNAGARRVRLVSKSLAHGGVKVFICTLFDVQGEINEVKELAPGVFALSGGETQRGEKLSVFKFINAVEKFMSFRKSDRVIYLYPTTFIFKDLLYLLYFKYKGRYRFFCDINELRSSISFFSLPTGNFISGIWYYIKSPVEWVFYKLNEFQALFYNGIVVISTALKKHYSRYTKSALRIPILCDSDQITKSNSLKWLSGEPFRICFAGYISFAKEGFDILLKALSEVQDSFRVELFLYGFMDEKNKFLIGRLARQLGVEGNIKYMGNLDPDLLQAEYLKYHLLILPRPLNRVTRFGFSTKLSEYLMAGRPVLATDVSDNAMYLRDNYNCFLIKPGSSQVMSDRLRSILVRYNQQASSIVEGAHATVRDELDYRIFSEELLSFLYK